MDLTAFFILFAPLILLYTHSPNLRFSSEDAVENLVGVVVVALLSTLVAWILPILARRPRRSLPGKPGARTPWFSHGVSIFLVFVFASLVEFLDWIETFDALFFPPDTFLVADLLLLLPFLIPFVVFRTNLAHRSLLVRGRTSSLPAALETQLRLLVVVLGPQLLYLNAYAWLVQGFEPSALLIEQHPWLNFVIVGVLIFLLLTYSPYFVRLLYSRVPLENHPAASTYRDAFAQLSRLTGIALDRVSIWVTGTASVANAAVSGAFRRQRTVFLTDRLLEILDPLEVQAVVAHELGHAYHRHLLLMLPVALLSSVFVVWTLFLVQYFVDVGEALGPVVILLQMLYLLLFYRPISQRFEFQADAYAAWRTGSPEHLSSSLLKLSSDQASSRSKASLTHPSIAQRVQRLSELFEKNDGDLTSVVKRALTVNRLMVLGMTVLIVLTIFLNPE